MKRASVILSIMIILLMTSIASAQAVSPLMGRGAAGPAGSSDSAGKYLIVFANPNAVPGNAAQIVANSGGVLLKTIPGIGVGIATSNDPGFAAKLASHKNVVSVAEDPLLQWLPGDMQTYLHAESLPMDTPASHDPTAAALFDLQWNMRAIEADLAWAAGHLGSPAVSVAILDTGIDPTHIDMISTVDATRSASFVEDLADLPECSDSSLIAALFPGQPDWIDLHFHGTHVGGIVAAQGLGVSGVSPHVQLIAVKVLNVCGFGFFSWVIDGIVYAADVGADVINMSLGARFPRSCMFEDVDRRDLRNECAALMTALNRATNYAHRQGTLVISSAGNSATNADADKDVIIVPAQSSNVVGVSATGPIAAIGVEPDMVASYTDFGHSLVDVAAPGGDFRRFPDGDWFLDMVLSPCSRFSLVVPVCQTGNFFLFAAGTSMSAPHVSGVAALIDSKHNGGLNAAQLRARVQQSADDLGKPGADPFYGHGRVNAFQAVQR